jgi:hypothetical protein
MHMTTRLQARAAQSRTLLMPPTLVQTKLSTTSAEVAVRTICYGINFL